MQVLWSELDTRLLSPRLWSKFAPPVGGVFRSTASGNPAIGFFDDFLNFGGLLATNDGLYHSEGNHYRSYQTASCYLLNVACSATPASVAPTSYGAISFNPTSGVVDNDTVSLAWGGNFNSPYGSFPFNVIPGMSKDLAFECRIQVSSIAETIGNVFVGLAGAAGVDPVAAAVPITQSDAFATTQSLLGFGRLAAASTGAFGLYYERASGTTASVAGVATAVAATYIKLGFYWDAARQEVIPYIDGAKVARSLQVAKATTGATPWPNDYMTAVAGIMQTDGTTAQKLTMDWWACAQAV